MVTTARETKVKPGYKVTKVGTISEEWEVTSIGEIAFVTKLAGFEYTKYFNYRQIGPIIAIKALNIKNGRLDLTEVQTIPLETSKSLPRSQLAKGDLVISYVGALLGQVAIIPEDNKFHLAPNVAKIRLISKNLNQLFLSQYLNGKQGQSSIYESIASSGQPALSMRTLREITIIFPPLPEQKAIATALSDIDALITSLDKLIAKKRDIKQATMQELLTGKTRLPGFSKDINPKYKRTEIGIIPIEWSFYKFEQLATIRKKKIDSRNFINYPFCVELEHIGQGSGQLIGYSALTQESSLKAQFNTGDILFGRLRAYLRKYWLANRDGICSTEIWPLIANPEVVNNHYLFQLVQMNSFIDTASSAYGTHMPRTDWNVIKKYTISLPPLNEQQAIATILSDMDAEIVALERKRDKTRALKQGMMQELLTGKTRLYEHSGPDRTHDAESSGQSLQHATEL